MVAFCFPRPPFGGCQIPCFRVYRSFLSSGFGAAGRGLQYFTIADKERAFDSAILPVAFYEHLCHNYYAEKQTLLLKKQ